MLAGYARFTGEQTSYAEIVHAAKLQIMREELAAEVERLTGLLADVCERHRRQRDHTRRELRDALREMIAAFPVYRTYARPGQPAQRRGPGARGRRRGRGPLAAPARPRRRAARLHRRAGHRSSSRRGRGRLHDAVRPGERAGHGQGRGRHRVLPLPAPWSRSTRSAATRAASAGRSEDFHRAMADAARRLAGGDAHPVDPRHQAQR